MTGDPIDATLARRLVREQFPRWRDLPVRPVDADGWDNRTFRLGEELSIRLPSGPGYAPQVRKEIADLPRIAAGVSLPVPEIVGIGAPDTGYPFEWTVRRWIDGIPLAEASGVDSRRLALDVAAFLRELAAVDPSGGPAPGPHSAGRGGPVAQWDREVVDALNRLEGRADGPVDAPAARRVWNAALGADDSGPTRWFHGDVAVRNLLTTDGRLSAVIDFGCAGVGDTACDLVFGWNVLEHDARDAFRRALDVDDAAWARGAGWALWKALITVDDPLRHRESAFALRQLLG